MQHLAFVVVMNLEKGRSKALAGFKSADLIPVDSFSWLERTESSSSAFVTIYNQDFRPKLARELVDLEQEHHDAISSLNDAYTCLSLPAQKILSGLDDLLVENPAKDPWLCELTVRHNSAQYLEHKAAYLDVLYRIYSQVRHLNGESDHKLTALSNEFVLILERFSLDFNNFPNSSTQTSTSMWQDILKEYSLDYDWKLQCPPLDGFLCTLYTENIPRNIFEIWVPSEISFGPSQSVLAGPFRYPSTGYWIPPLVPRQTIRD